MSGEDLRTNPYVGLRPFFATDSLYFYGREDQTAQLLEILRQHRFLGVVGSSGSGKSSLVRAGLLPSLLGGFLVQDRDIWRTVQIKPGDAPVGNLCRGLYQALGEQATPQAAALLEHDIREGHTDAVLEFLTTRLEKNANLFLLVDQFEEIFAFRGNEEDEAQGNLDLARRKERARRKAEAADFVDLLLALAVQRQLPIYVALTMRTDFLGDCDLFHGLPEALNRGRYLVPRMTRDQLRDAVECPALLLDAHIAPRLLDHVLNELGDRFDRLPVLQHALLRTWDKWQAAGGIGPIDLPHFEAAGGLERALAQDADAALRGLDAGATARVFKRLTDTDLSQRRVRSPARVSELMAASGADRATVQAVVRRFEEDGRSFVHQADDGKPDDPRVDISHESLIRQWDSLRNWVDDERQSRDQYKELVLRARKRAMKTAALLQDPELQMAIDWRAKVLPSSGWAQRYSTADGDYPVATAYLDESQAVRNHALAESELLRRWNQVWGRLIILVFVMIVASYTSQRTDVGRKLQEKLAAPATSQMAQGTPEVTQLEAAVSKDNPDSAAGKVAGQLESGLDSLGAVFKEFGYLGLFLAAYLGVTRLGKWMHRELRYPAILRGIQLRDGRSALETKVAEELRDAVVVHNTTYAGTFQRMAAYMIDWLCYSPLFLAAILVVEIVRGFPDENTYSDEIVVVIMGLWVVFAWLYETLQIVSKKQATVGMRALGIFRTDMHGGRLSFAAATKWYGYRLLTYVSYGLGFLTQIRSAKRQTFHDRMAGTVVLRRPAPQDSSAMPVGAPQPAAG